MRGFPDSITWENWGSLMTDTALFEPLVRKALMRAGLAGESIRAGYPGTNAVFTVDDAYVVKLYAPLCGLCDAQSERACCRLMRAERFPCVPALYGEGTVDGWEYIVTEYVPGDAARDVWADLSSDRRQAAGRFVGQWAKAYHALPNPFPADSPLSAAQWEAELSARMEKNAARLLREGCDSAFVGELSHAARAALSDQRAIVLTHSDLTEDHLLIQGRQMRVIDFADSRMAYSCLEWPPLWFGLFARDEGAFSEYLRAAGEEYRLDDMVLSLMLHAYGAPILLSSVPELRNLSHASDLYPRLYCPRT